MKKIFILFAIIILFLGCEFTDSALPNTTTQKPLDIRYSTVPDATVQKATIQYSRRAETVYYLV